MKDIYKKMYNSGGRLDLAHTPRISVMLGEIDCLDLENKNILDVGCYDGTFLSLIKNRNNNFFGIEASDYGVKKSRERGIDVRHFFLDDKTKFPYPDSFFDLVIAGEIIEHIYDTDFFLDEISRILKPGGKLLISTPNIASCGRRLLLFLGINPIIEITPNEDTSSGHIRYFTFKTLADLLIKHNFRVIAKDSDNINLSSSGRIRLSAKFFPMLGQSIIYLCNKM